MRCMVRGVYDLGDLGDLGDLDLGGPGAGD
jgi:hypothetical protein